MNEMNRVELEAEAPVNPYSLLEAVNRSSNSANTAWLIYIGLMSYLLVTVAGVTHKDLLLNADIALPILQVKIDLTRFFLFAPIVLLLVHIGVVGQLVLLARKTLEFGAAVRMLEATDQRTHPLRLELDNFFFVQALAGPERSPVVGFVLNAMTWLTLVAMPVALIAYVQLSFLPYHDPTITWVHRFTLLGDIAFVALAGVFLLHLEISLLRALLYAGLYHPLSFLLTAGLLAAVAIGSLFVATIPGEGVGRYSPSFIPQADGDASGTAPVLGLFRRNLNVVDADLVVDKDATPGEPTLSLRGRDLRFARLDRTDLHQADLTGANLDGASLAGADLRGVSMGCASLSEMLLTDSRRAGGCASARGANFTRARLSEARMAGADLAGSQLDEAELDGARLAQSNLAGASFASARLDRADLAGAELSGANFLLASLQGADLAGARLQMADFSSASMPGANLSLASLEGAVLNDAEMEGAALAMARLIGTDLTGARMQGADLTRAVVWRTTPPGGENAAFADMAQIRIQPPSAQDLAAMKAAIERLEGGTLQARLDDGLAPLMDPARNAAWAAAEQQQWQGFTSSSDPAGADGYKSRLTDYLMRLICRTRFANGAVATGVARRAMAPGFKGDMLAIHDKLKAADCPASAAMDARTMRNLAIAADATRGQ
jgi:uncharacterized protein YjbI with pentapeptide repeats